MDNKVFKVRDRVKHVVSGESAIVTGQAKGPCKTHTLSEGSTISSKCYLDPERCKNYLIDEYYISSGFGPDGDSVKSFLLELDDRPKKDKKTI